MGSGEQDRFRQPYPEVTRRDNITEKVAQRTQLYSKIA